MSRIGKKPVQLESGITVAIEGQVAKIVGPKGQLEIRLPQELDIIVADNEAKISLKKGSRAENLLGLGRSLIQNAVTGVKTGWSKSLQLVGVGFRAQTDGNKLTLNVGFAEPVIITAPAGINIQVAEDKITVSGADKYLVGELAASIRRIKKPEPYKGKGIRYVGEHIRKKMGKAGKTVGAGAPK